jgi:putative hemolysin
VEPDPISIVVFGFSVLAVVFAVVAELSLSTVNRHDIRTLRAQGNSNALVVDGLLRDRVQLLATTMLLKTAGLVAAGGAIVRILPGSDELGQYGVAIIGTWIMLALVQVVARSLVQPHAEKTALALARYVQVAYLLLWPVAALVRQVGQQVGPDEKSDAEESVFMSDQSLRLLMDADDDQEPILESEKEMIESILEMDETVAREVMVPRIDIVSLSVEATLREALDTVIAMGHSRIPVYEENIDHIVGFLYAKDLLKCFRDNLPDMPIRSLLRPAHFVPATKKLNDLLREMQKHDGGGRVWRHGRAGDN